MGENRDERIKLISRIEKQLYNDNSFERLRFTEPIIVAFITQNDTSVYVQVLYHMKELRSWISVL